MEMIELGAQALKGAALDWAVAQVEGLQVDIVVPPVVDERNQPAVLLNKARWMSGHEPAQIYSPSTDWAQGGPLFDRYDMRISDGGRLTEPNGEKIRAVSVHRPNGHTGAYMPTFAGGPTVLRAACRALVAEKLGGESMLVHVPAQLVEGKA